MSRHAYIAYIAMSYNYSRCWYANQGFPPLHISVPCFTPKLSNLRSTTDLQPILGGRFGLLAGWHRFFDGIRRIVRYRTRAVIIFFQSSRRSRMCRRLWRSVRSPIQRARSSGFSPSGTPRPSLSIHVQVHGVLVRN